MRPGIRPFPTKTSMKYFLIFGTLLFSLTARAYAPGLSCQMQGETVQCIGSYSDGSSVFGVDIKVLNYNDKVLFEGTLDKESRIEFPKPVVSEYYVKFDGGSGHILELDHADIQ